MNDNLREYRKQRHETVVRAESVLSLLNPDETTNFFEDVEGMAPVRKVWRRAIESYQVKHGKLPAERMLASAHAALERVIKPTSRAGFRNTGPMFESAIANMSTSLGVLEHPNWAAIILPTILTSNTEQLCTFMNVDKDQTDLLQLIPYAVTGGDATPAGDVLDGYNFHSYGTMSRLLTLETGKEPDGTITKFSFGAPFNRPYGWPIRPGTVRMRIDDSIIAVDPDVQQYTPNVELYAPPGLNFPNGLVSYGHIHVSINYLDGTVNLDFTSQPPAAGTVITLEVDVDEEEEPRLIPELNERCFRARVHASRYMMAAGSSVQAYHDFRREVGLDLNETLTNAAANWLAGEVDKRRLRTALFYANNRISIDATRRTDDLGLWAEGLKRRIIVESDKMQALNKNVGITGAYAGERVAQLFRSLPEPLFVPDASAHITPGIRRAGRLFGLLDVWIVPKESFMPLFNVDVKFMDRDVLFFGSDGSGHSPLVAGDGIPPTLINSGTPDAPNPDLRFRSTVFGTEISALNPFGGQNYLLMATFDNL
ncbi:MAG: hypothetical protein ACDS79_07960 [Enterobacteriaceae bacterium]